MVLLDSQGNDREAAPKVRIAIVPKRIRIGFFGECPTLKDFNHLKILSLFHFADNDINCFIHTDTIPQSFILSNGF